MAPKCQKAQTGSTNSPALNPPPPPPPPPPTDAEESTDNSRGRNAYERRLWAAVLDAAGGGPELSLEDAKVGLKVVSVGRYNSSEGRACACGKKPLQQVFHLRHEGTGRQLDIGKSCATRFHVLGSLETQEAERALRNLEQLGEDPESEMGADLRKFARSNGLIVEEESDMIKAGRPAHVHRIAELKAMVVVGLTFVHRTSEEISHLLQAQSPVPSSARQALVRLAVLGDRKQLLTIFDIGSLKNEDLELGRGGLVEKPCQSLVAEAVSRSLQEEVRVLLNAVGWSGPHGRAAFRQGLISVRDDFVDIYLSRKDVAPPDEVAARLAVQSHKSLRGLQAIICWCLCFGGATAQAVLDEALREACQVASESAVQQLMDAGARARDSVALLRWCARLGGSGCAQAVELQDVTSGVRVAEALISKGGARPSLAGRQLERGCLHFAAAAGDVALLELLMRHGSSPWECTFLDSVRPCRELQRGCIQHSERQLPLEVAKVSERDTSKVEHKLRVRMAEDLDLACQSMFNPKPAWLEESLQSIRCRAEHGDVDSCTHKVLSMFGKHVDLLRQDPAKAQHEAMQRQRLKEERKRREEEERVAREQAQAEEEERRQRQKEEARRKREAAEREFAEKEARRKEKQKQEEAEAQRRRAEERRANLGTLLRDGEQMISSGPEAGLTFEEATRARPFFLRHVIDGTPSSEALLRFAKIRIRFVEAEIHHAKKNMDSDLDLLHGETMKKEAEWTAMREAEDKAWRVEKKGITFKDAFDTILRCQDWTLNGKGKYSGRTFESTFRADRDYADWWIRQGPGSNTSFGRFAEARMKVSVSDIEAEEQRRAKQEALKENQQPGRLTAKSFEPHACSSDVPPQTPSSEHVHLDRPTALAMVASLGKQCFLNGKYKGSSYLQVANTDPDYVKWWLDKGPGKNTSFGRFADSWNSHSFSMEEIATAQLPKQNAAEEEPKAAPKRLLAESTSSPSRGTKNSTEPAAARIRVQSPSLGSAAQEALLDGHQFSAMQSTMEHSDLVENLMSASSQKGCNSHFVEDVQKEDLAQSAIGAPSLIDETTCSHTLQPQSSHDPSPSELGHFNRDEVMTSLLREGQQSFSKGKYQGLTYFQVASAHSDYLDWWLDKGPGKENNFGRFADSWRSSKITTEELAAAQQMRQNDSEDLGKGPAKRLQEDTKHSADENAETANELPAKRLRVEVAPSAPQHEIPDAGSSDDEDEGALLEACAMLDQTIAREKVAANFPNCLEISTGCHSQSSDEENSLLAACAAVEHLTSARVSTAFSNQSCSMTSSEANLLASDRGPLLMKLGKHRGRSYEDVLRSDPGWCRWAQSQANPSPVLRDFIEYLAAVQSSGA